MATLKAAAKASTSATPIFSGRNKGARQIGFSKIRRNAFNEAMGVAKDVANLKLVLGTRPEGEAPASYVVLKQAARDEFMVGRYASELVLKLGMTEARAFALAEDVMLRYASATAKKLGDKQGRRNTEQEARYNALKVQWSQRCAEAGHGDAQVQKVVKKSKRKARGKTSQQATGTPTSQLVTAPPTFEALAADKGKAYTPRDYVDHMVHALATLTAIDNKRAVKRPIAFGKFAEMLKALHAEAISAADAFHKATSEAMARANK